MLADGHSAKLKTQFAHARTVGRRLIPADDEAADQLNRLVGGEALLFDQRAPGLERERMADRGPHALLPRPPLGPPADQRLGGGVVVVPNASAALRIAGTSGRSRLVLASI